MIGRRTVTNHQSSYTDLKQIESQTQNQKMVRYYSLNTLGEKKGTISTFFRQEVLQVPKNYLQPRYIQQYFRKPTNR